MNSAIVTGANGFIGKWLVRSLLKNGIMVYAVVRNRDSISDVKSSHLKIIEADFDSYDDVLTKQIPYGVDIFYQLSWIGASGTVLTDYHIQAQNIELCCSVLETAHKIGCKKFIFAGTINELELMQFFDGKSRKVETPRKSCIYGISKFAADFMLRTLAGNLGISYNTAIIGSCFGPGDKSRRIHNNTLISLLQGEPPKLISGDTLHDWIYVEDVADMFVAIGKKSISQKVYYMGHQELRRLDDIVSDVRDVVAPAVELRFGDFNTPFFIDYSYVDMNGVYEDTGYMCRSSFKECIKKTAEWVQETFLGQ